MTDNPTLHDRQARLDLWAKESWLCFLDHRYDLVLICLDELGCVARETAPPRWEAEGCPSL